MRVAAGLIFAVSLCAPGVAFLAACWETDIADCCSSLSQRIPAYSYRYTGLFQEPTGSRATAMPESASNLLFPVKNCRFLFVRLYPNAMNIAEVQTLASSLWRP